MAARSEFFRLSRVDRRNPGRFERGMLSLLLVATISSCGGGSVAPQSEKSAAYTLECAAAIAALVEVSPAALFDQGKDIMWAELAEVLENTVVAFGKLDPPHEFQDYHDARMDFLRVYRDLAVGRPSSGSAVDDYTVFAITIMPQVMQVVLDSVRSEAEREQMARALIHEKYAEFYGSEFSDASLRQQQALSDLPIAAREALSKGGCHPTHL